MTNSDPGSSPFRANPVNNPTGNGPPPPPPARFSPRLGWTIGGVVVAGLIVAQSVTVIPAGYVGVVFSSFTGVKPNPLQEGLHFVMPFVDHVTTYDARLQEVTLSQTAAQGDEGSISARSKEGLDITAEVTVQFRIDRAKAAILHKELGRNYINTALRPQVRAKVRDAIGQFGAADLISNQRAQLEGTITTELNKSFSRNNLILDAILLRELKIPESVAKAIEEKQTAEQQVAVERNRLQQAEISAQRDVVKAEGEAKAAIATARGQAEALSLRGKSLKENPQLIQLTVAERLAPGIQTIMLPSDGNFLLDLKSLGVQTQPKAAPTPSGN
ncbi:prohibitin family protein [Deinococcus radiopugnans]|uniref:Prohibitin family protein n=1 Tax=Deinococcus radiopugnans ATCC 19172 TaxID=585398 RepID=A0A5C4XXY7_9DEIO|nr:prohibitin family protein [Deinococcus radiopugnans]MBB6018472.1 regulator of protease activity HflC (stomatin/prohibitin superfamily) [Deinococcus radiopugnans ATCC 19172]TNM67522.1 prohibitin family protein [Deinococcus radiopugnans ATCC 19172]